MSIELAGKTHLVNSKPGENFVDLELDKELSVEQKALEILKQENLDKTLLLDLDIDLLKYLDQELRLPVGVFYVNEEDLQIYFSDRNLTFEEIDECETTIKQQIRQAKEFEALSVAGLVILNVKKNTYLSEIVNMLKGLTSNIETEAFDRALRLIKQSS